MRPIPSPTRRKAELTERALKFFGRRIRTTTGDTGVVSHAVVDGDVIRIHYYPDGAEFGSVGITDHEHATIVKEES